MTVLPAPLVPAECSMAGNDWFPLHFDRLRKSKWWRRASDLARARNVMLWGEAYKQVPAGSMPDDDDELAEAAGFGMDVESFIDVKDEIMAPWTMCSDGRWYHPTVCEVVLDGWAKASERRKKDAERKARQRAQVRGVTPHTPNVPQDSPQEHQEVTRDTSESARDIGTQTQQTGQDRTDKNPPTPQAGGGRDLDFERFWKSYPSNLRSTVAKPLVRERFDEAIDAGATMDQLMAGAAEMQALANAGGRPLRIDRFLEKGLWRNQAASDPAPTAQPWSGPEEVWTLAVGAKGEAWARRFVGSCAFRDGALVCASPTLAKGIRLEIGRDLDDLGYRLLQGAVA